MGTTGAPLIVVDGVPGGDINAINPNDIESISIIKDAASAAIYGSSAPYGALLITTKQGKEAQPRGSPITTTSAGQRRSTCRRCSIPLSSPSCITKLS